MTTDPAEHLARESLNATSGPARAEAEGARAPAWAQEHLEVLRELRDMGMQLARSLTRQAPAQVETSEAEEPPRRAAPVDPALSFSRISRAVRLTLALETRIHQAIEAAAHASAKEASAKEASANDDARTDGFIDYEGITRQLNTRAGSFGNDYDIRRAVEETIEASHDDPDDVERLKDELKERLDEDEVFDYRATWPIGEAIALICQDLGLEPDWDRWETTKWARKEAEESPRGSPYATIARPPLPPNQHPRTGTDRYREARGLPPLEQPPLRPVSPTMAARTRGSP